MSSAGGPTSPGRTQGVAAPGVSIPVPKPNSVLGGLKHWKVGRGKAGPSEANTGPAPKTIVTAKTTVTTKTLNARLIFTSFLFTSILPDSYKSVCPLVLRERGDRSV